MKKGQIINHLIIFFVVAVLGILPVSVHAEENVEIQADNLEYISKDNAYIARGSVKILFKEASLTADEMRLDGESGDAEMTGDILYEDPDTIIRGTRIRLNLKTRLGTIYESYVFYKKRNVHLKGQEIQKIGDRTFFLDRATITTCDAEPPAWQITARNITATQNRSLTARGSALRIRNTPILYTPFFWAPLNRDRQTGFLFPLFGYSSERGHYFKQGFFWAIQENQDATLYLDYYSEKGLAEGLDYRYIFDDKTDGEWWVYHVRDNEPVRDLYEIKLYHNQSLPHEISGYLKLHLINEFDYYNVMESTSQDRFGLSTWKTDKFGFLSEERLQKYLESDFHLFKPFQGGRVYLLGQSRQSIEGPSDTVPQSFPEIGFILYTNSYRHVSFNFAALGTHFWREEGQRGIRFDINPNLYFSFGRLVTFTQKIGVRDTSYFLDTPTLHKSRLIADFSSSISTKLLKRYKSYIHLVEPSVEYTYIPPLDNDNIPFFDAVDLIDHASRVTYSLTNRLSGLTGLNLEARLRLSQSYNFLDVDKDFSPILTEATLSSNPVALSMNASYDVHDNQFSDIISSIIFTGKEGYIGFGKNFRRITELNQYTFEAGLYRPINIGYGRSLPIDFNAKVWYDVKGGGVQDMQVSSSYKHQCWGFSLTYTRRPDQYQIIFAVELTGIGTLKLGSI